MVKKRPRVQRFSEKIGMVLCRSYVGNLKLPVSNTPPKVVMTDINVLYVRVFVSRLRKLNNLRQNIFFVLPSTPSILAPWWKARYY